MFKTNGLCAVGIILLQCLIAINGQTCEIDTELYKPNPESCTSYYQCDNAIFKLRECPDGLHFNAEISVCDWPQAANCRAPPINDAPTNPPPTAPPTNPPPTAPPTNPPPTAPPTNPPPTNPPTQPPPTAPPTQPPIDPPISPPTPPPLTHNECPLFDTDHDVFLPHPNCNLFYKCIAGVPHERLCPPGLHWNAQAEYCDYQETANCKYGGAPDQPGAIPLDPEDIPPQQEEPHTSCPSEDPENLEDAVHIAHPNCSMFYTCVAGVPHEQSCPPGLHWNVEENWCDWEHEADCVDGAAPELPDAIAPIPDEPTPPPPIHSACPAIDLEHPVHIAHPNCSMFYTCLGGRPHEHLCPHGLHWNIAANWCDWPTEANCQDGAAPPQPDAVPIPQPPTEQNVSGYIFCPSVNPPNFVVHLPHPNCNFFYKCDKGVAYEQLCPFGYYWNQKNDYCDYPHLAGCNFLEAPAQLNAISLK